MSQSHNHLNHATWECKYHVVCTPKYRKKVLFGQIRQHLGTVFHELARRKECQIEEGHLMPDVITHPGPRCSFVTLRKITEGRSAHSLSLLVASTSRRVRNTSSLSRAVTAMAARR